MIMIININYFTKIIVFFLIVNRFFMLKNMQKNLQSPMGVFEGYLTCYSVMYYLEFVKSLTGEVSSGVSCVGITDSSFFLYLGKRNINFL